jgi:D-alanyl-D-alanine dipeptidase
MSFSCPQSSSVNKERRSYAGYPSGTSLQRWHRELLRRVMEEEGFLVYPFEWWHFGYHD